MCILGRPIRTVTSTDLRELKWSGRIVMEILYWEWEVTGLERKGEGF